MVEKKTVPTAEDSPTVMALFNEMIEAVPSRRQ